jgi:hypothetical protein
VIATGAEPDQPTAPPRAVAFSGVIFAALYITSLVLVRLAVPADPTDPGAWLVDPTSRSWVGVALNLVPFAGIAFLWYMAVLRSHIGLKEDQLFGTVFLGSGFLFVAMTFATAAVSQGLHSVGASESLSPSETYRTARGMTYALMMTFSMKMAAVFMFVTSAIGLRTAVLSRWVSFVGFAFGLVLLLVVTNFAWIALLFPLWVLLVSTWILMADFRQCHTVDPETSK